MRLCELTKAEVVVIDTTGRAIEGEENSADSYREFARTTGLALKRAGIACVRTDHAGKDGGKKHGQRGSSAKNDDVDIVYRLDKTDDGLKLIRTHTRISWVPAEVDLIVEDIDDITTIRQRKIIVKGWTEEDIRISKILDDLNIPKTWGRDKVRALAVERGVELGSNNALGSAIKMRKTLKDKPTPDRTDAQDSFLQPNEVLGTPHRTDRYGVSQPQNLEDFDLDKNY